MQTSEKLVLYTMSYATIFNYAVILSLLAYNQTNFTDYSGLALRFGLGAFISIFSSIFIIRNHIEQKQLLKTTFIKIAIAHIPTIIGLIFSFLYIFD